MPRIIIAGEPGSTHRNDTDKILYQLVVKWSNSCGLCIQNDHRVGTYWPIPFHRSCNCTQLPVMPGQESAPFVDFREKIHTVSPAQQAAIMGRANLTLVESGIVDWSDVVTPGRVRSLREVVARNKLTVDRMAGAGVPKRLAQEAHDAVHTGTHTASEARRKQLLDAMLAKGYTRGQILDAAGNAIGSRVGLSGPSGPSSIPMGPATPKPTPAPSPAPSPAPPSVPMPKPPKVGRAAKPRRISTVRAALNAAEAAAREVPAIASAERLAAEHGVAVRPNGRDNLLVSFGDRVDRVPAAYSAAGDAIMINERSEYWADPRGWMERMSRSGWLSSSDPDHIITHEIGHALHRRHSPEEFARSYGSAARAFDPATLAMIAGKVSLYAETSPVEFVAEVYAGLKAGKDYDGSVMGLYRDLGGPPP